MSLENGTERNQQAVDRFWHNYMSILENSSSVHTKARVWYRRHVQDYITAHQGVKLQHHLPQNIDTYLIAKGRMQVLLE